MTRKRLEAAVRDAAPERPLRADSVEKVPAAPVSEEFFAAQAERQLLAEGAAETRQHGCSGTTTRLRGVLSGKSNSPFVSRKNPSSRNPTFSTKSARNRTCGSILQPTAGSSAVRRPGSGGADLGARLDLDQGLVLDQAGDDDHGHHREVAAHDPAVGFADLALAGEVFLLVGDVPGQAGDVAGLAAGGADDGDDVGERLLHLADEVVGSKTWAAFQPIWPPM